MTRPKDVRGGIDVAAEMINGLDPQSRERLMRNVAARDPQLARKILKQLFGFTDLVHVIDREIQELVREIPAPRLALALRGVPDALKEHILSNMSRRAAELLRQDIEAMGPQKRTEVEAAQDEIMEVAKRMESEGKILLKRP